MRVGTEPSVAGALRWSLTLQHLSVSEDGTHVNDQRATLAVSAAPVDGLAFSAAIPFVWRETETPTLARDVTLGLGDPDVRARFTLFQDRAFAPAHRVTAQVGLQFPTPTPAVDARGVLLPLDAQPGTGSFDPLLGVGWSWFQGALSMHTGATLAVPTEGLGGFRNGPSVRGSWQGQWQPSTMLALGLGLDARLDAPSAPGSSERESDRRTPPDVAVVVFVSPTLMFTPAADWMVWSTVRVPFAQAAGPLRSDGPIVECGVAFDAW